MVGRPLRQQAPADGHHIDHRDDQQGQADEGKFEVTKWLLTGRGQGISHNDVGRGSGQGQQAAGVGGVGQAHQELRGHTAQAPGRGDHGGHQCGHGAGVADERRQSGRTEHHVDQQTLGTAAGRAQQLVAQPHGDAGARQAFADDEQGGDQDHGGIAEPGQRLLRREDAGQIEGQQGHQRHDVRPDSADNEQDDGDGQNDEGGDHEV